MTKLNDTTYNTVANNTVFDAVLDAAAILAWRQNVKAVVDANSPEGQYAADSGSTDAYAITLSPVPSAYVTGMVVMFKANTTNTGAATLDVNGLGAKTIKKSASSDLSDSDILSGQIVEVVYDGTNFQLLSTLPLISNLMRVLSGGAKIQSGTVLTSGTTFDATVTFPVAFASAPIVVASVWGTSGAYFAVVIAVSATATVLKTFNGAGTGIQNNASWIAIGT